MDGQTNKHSILQSCKLMFSTSYSMLNFNPMYIRVCIFTFRVVYLIRQSQEKRLMEGGIKQMNVVIICLMLLLLGTTTMVVEGNHCCEDHDYSCCIAADLPHIAIPPAYALTTAIVGDHKVLG